MKSFIRDINFYDKKSNSFKAGYCIECGNLNDAVIEKLSKALTVDPDIDVLTGGTQFSGFSSVQLLYKNHDMLPEDTLKKIFLLVVAAL